MTISVYYDYVKGWEQTNPGWHEAVIHIEDSQLSLIQYIETIYWIKDNIGGYLKHSRWIYDGTYSKYKFRYERDYLWFKLTWG